MASKIPLAIFLAISVLFVFPLAVMVYGSLIPSFSVADRTRVSLQLVAKAFTAPDTPSLLENTIIYGAGGSAIAVLLGATFAWFMERTDIPGKKVLRFLPILPLTLPLVVKGFAWVFLFHPRIGLVNLALEGLFHLSGPVFNIYSMWGMVFAWGVGGVPLAFLMVEAAIQSMDPSLEEASRAAGNGILRTVARVTIPVTAPAVLSAYLLLTIMGTENFDYPFLLGSPAGINTLATKLYSLVNSRFQISLASAYGLIYLMMTFIIIAGYLWSVRRSFRFVVVTGKATRFSVFKLGKWRWPSFAFCLGILFFAFILPMSMIVLVSLVPFYTVGGGYNPFAVLTLANYFKAIQVPQFLLSVVNSFELSLSAAVITTLVGTIMAYAMVKGKTRGKRVLEYLSSLPLAFPGILYAIGMIWTAFLIPGLIFIYGTIWIMLVALIVVWLPFSIRFVATSLVQVSDELEEASSVVGAGWPRMFRKVLMPLLKGGILNSFVYVMVNSFRELGAVVILSNASSIVMIVLILNYFEQQASSYPVVAAMSTMMTIMLAGVIVATRFIGKSKIRG